MWMDLKRGSTQGTEHLDNVVSILAVFLWLILLRGNRVRPFTKYKTHTAASAHHVRSFSSVVT